MDFLEAEWKALVGEGTVGGGGEPRGLPEQPGEGAVSLNQGWGGSGTPRRLAGQGVSQWQHWAAGPFPSCGSENPLPWP